MSLSIIAAIASNNVIGIANQLPWHLPADLKHFKELTWGKPMLMGRKTFESIGKVLPGRRHLIVTHDPSFSVPGCEIYHSIEEALSSVNDKDELMVIGGAALFKVLLPRATRLYLTQIHQDFNGDAYFPEWNPADWAEISRTDFDADDENRYAYSFVIFERRS